jgi:glycosyltransferase involved in cell wall biosynthesis
MSLPSYLQSLEAVLSGTSNSFSPTTATPTTSTTVPTPTSAPSGPSSSPFSMQQGLGLNTFNPLNAAATNTTIQIPNEKKLKFLLVGTHCHQVTGYSKVTYGLIKQLSKESILEVTHFGFQRHGGLSPNYRPYPPNIRVIDAAELERRAQPPNSPNQQGFGFNVLPDVIRSEKPDVVFIYNDMMVITRFLEELRKSGVPRTFKIWLYVDQVYNTQLQALLDIINRDADRVFAFTQYWKKCLKDQGITRPIDILGHGFERDVFTPLNKEETRKKLGLPPDVFIITSLNRNQPRKRYDILLMSFVELIAKYPTKPIFLMCICDKGEKGGWWLFEIFQRELRLRNLPIERFNNRLVLTTSDMNFRDEDINMFYNIADIGISSADGEGWGLCNFEQMGVGIPQVVPDIGGFKEFCSKDNTVIVKPKYRVYQPTVHSPVGGESEAVDPHDLCLGVEEYLLDSEKRRKHGEAARKAVLEFTWENVTKMFIKRLHQEHEDKDS